MRRLARSLYCWLLRLHPQSFRQEFADEMLWIFDQAEGRGVGRLLADGLLSLVRQRMLRPAAVGAAGQLPGDVPVFYTCERFLPGPGALLHGAALSLAAFCVVTLAFSARPSQQKPLLLPGLGLSPDYQVVAWHGPSRATGRRFASVYFRLSPVLGALDANRDGEISAAEIENAPEALRGLDKNGDGRLSAGEVIW
jgi:hypothetical protein